MNLREVKVSLCQFTAILICSSQLGDFLNLFFYLEANKLYLLCGYLDNFKRPHKHYWIYEKSGPLGTPPPCVFHFKYESLTYFCIFGLFIA